ncbi:hypothetical protein [Streptomyces torulosus]|uniref:hypothetical protein n=1 Tax=Streptomyces torulosus TaxID=68276 RepID=UPI0006EBC932|nr:hypothetical protein [Streptomyces torulosus]
MLSTHGRCGCLTDAHVARLSTAAQAKGESPGELPLPVKDTDGKGIDLLLRLCNFANAETACLAIAWLIGCSSAA